MDTLKIRQNLILALTALIVATVMSVLPRNVAFADTIEGVGVTRLDTQPQDTALLRRLLSNPQPSAEQRFHLERALDAIGEELADASAAPRSASPFGAQG